MQKLLVIPEYKPEAAFLESFYKLSSIFLIQSKIHTKELNMFSKGEASFSDITEVSLEVRLEKHCTKAGDTD